MILRPRTLCMLLALASLLVVLRGGGGDAGEARAETPETAFRHPAVTDDRGRVDIAQTLDRIAGLIGEARMRLGGKSPAEDVAPAAAPGAGDDEPARAAPRVLRGGGAGTFRPARER